MGIKRDNKYASGYAPDCRPYTYTETNSSGEVVERGTISGDCELVFPPNGKWTLIQILLANAMFSGTSLSFAPVQGPSPNTKEGV